jgi:hypothetical protein
VVVPVDDAVDVPVEVTDVVPVLETEVVPVLETDVVGVEVTVVDAVVVGVLNAQPANVPSTWLRIAMFNVSTVASHPSPSNNAPPTVHETSSVRSSARYAATTPFNLAWVSLHESVSFKGALLVLSNVLVLQVTTPSVPSHSSITAFSRASWLSHASAGSER